MDKDYGKIGVLMGGPSAEREVSIRSGKAVLEGLLSRGYDAKPIEVFKPTMDELKSYDIDVAFIALHGSFGEDGELQSMLEELNIPYTGSKVEASRLAMDKIASRRIFERNRLCVPDYEVLKNGANPKLDFDMPVVVKPSAQGSSVGLTIVDKIDELKSAIERAFEFGQEIIIEKYIDGKEITVGILEDMPLPVIQIVPKRRFYDYIAKYTSGMTEYLVPAPISQAQFKLAQEAGLKAHKCLGCRSFSRVDMILSAQDTPIVLEVNTIPGLTELSLLPKAARVAGIEFPELCEKMLRSAF